MNGAAPRPVPSNDRRPLLDLFPSTPPPPTTESFYGLREQPFSLSTDPKFLYHSAAHDTVAQKLLSAVRRRDPVVVVTGEVGLGKTILCRAVMEELDQRTVTAFVTGPLDSEEHLLTAMLVAFGVVEAEEDGDARLENSSREALLTALQHFLTSLVSLNAFAVVFVDEAQRLSADVFEEMRGLSEKADNARQLQFVLVGQPALAAVLRSRSLKAWAGRTPLMCELGPLAPQEMVDYVSHRLSVAGANPQVDFTDDAAARIYELSAGVPTVVNLLCDRALGLGSRILASDIDVDLVNEAARELDIATAESVGRWLRRAAIFVVALSALVLAGALAAARAFHEPLSRLIVRWGG